MLSLIQPPVASARPIPPTELRNPGSEDEGLFGDPGLAAFLKQIGRMLGAETLWLRPVFAGRTLGPAIAGAGRHVIDAQGLADELDALAFSNRWQQSACGGWLIHSVMIHPRPQDSIALFASHAAASDFRPHYAEGETIRTLAVIEQFLAMWLRSHSARMQREMILTILDVAPGALVAIDESGVVHYRNAAAGHLLSGEALLSSDGNAIRIVDVHEALQFNVALQHVLQAQADPNAPPEQILVSIDRKRRRPLFLVLRALPLANTERPLALVQLIDPELELPPIAGSIGRHYGLTGVECRLAELLMRGRTIQEAADAMRLKEQTARTYLKQVFQKTGTNRQVDLVRLMLMISFPLAAAHASFA